MKWVDKEREQEEARKFCKAVEEEYWRKSKLKNYVGKGKGFTWTEKNETK